MVISSSSGGRGKVDSQEISSRPSTTEFGAGGPFAIVFQETEQCLFYPAHCRRLFRFPSSYVCIPYSLVRNCSKVPVLPLLHVFADGFQLEPDPGQRSAFFKHVGSVLSESRTHVTFICVLVRSDVREALLCGNAVVGSPPQQFLYLRRE